MYGRGKAGDCRKHVQKLNMMRGERDQNEGVTLLCSQHPPEDYASTFSLDETGRGDNRVSTYRHTIHQLYSLFEPYDYLLLLETV